MMIEERDSPRKTKRSAGCFCAIRSPEPKQRRSTVNLDVANLDLSSVTLLSILSNDSYRDLFRKFLDSRYMGETLSLFTQIESFDKTRRNKAQMAQQIYERFIDQNNESSTDTVTLSADLVHLVRKRLDNKEYDFLFREIGVELLVMMSANALSDFLASLHVPSLDECLTDRHGFQRFQKWARDVGLGDQVDFVHDCVEYEKNPSSEKGSAMAKRYFGSNGFVLDAQSMAPVLAATEKGTYEADTFTACKNEVMKMIMLNVYPRFVESISDNLRG